MSARRAILVMVCIAGWLAVVGVFGQRNVQGTLDARLETEASRAGLLADTIAAEIGREFGRLRSLVKILTRSDQIRATIPFVGYQEPPVDEVARLRRQAELQSRADIIEVNRMLTTTAEELGLRRIQLLHRSGEVIASSDWSRGDSDIGSVLSGDRLHAAASIVGAAGSFHIDSENVPGFHFAASIEIDGDAIGVLVIEQSSTNIARPLNGHRHRIFVTDEKGVSIIAREPDLLMAAAPDAPFHAITTTERLFRYGQRDVTVLPFETVEGGGGTRTLYRGDDGLDYAAVTRPFPSEPLWVNVFSPLIGQEALRWSALQRVGLIALVGLLVLLVIERSVAFALSTRAKNAQLRAANLQVEEAMEARSRFFARMSHEIRTPMTGILGMLEQLGLSTLNADQSWLLRTVTNSAESLITIINDILDFSKIEAGRLDLEILDVDVTEVTEQVARSIASVAAERGVTLRLSVDPAIRAHYRTNPTRLRQILFNFATNAVKFAEGGRVGLSVEKRETDGGWETIRFAIRDTGIGMDAATVERLFAPFAQADESTTRRFGGTGLGLSICKALADMMDGVISVDSAPGAGSTFILDLPLEPIEEMPIMAAPRDFFAGRRILVVGGDPDLGAAVLTNLPGAVAAASAAEADLVVALDDSAPPSEDQAFLRLVMAPGHGLPSWLHRNAAAAAVADALGLDPEAFRPHLAEEATSRALMSREEALATGKLILVADDHPVNREVLKRHIESLGYPVDLVEDGEKAWTRLGETAYGILLTDLHMPELDGLEAGELAYELEKRSFAGDLGDRDNLPNDVAHAVGAVLDFAREWLDNHARAGAQAS